MFSTGAVETTPGFCVAAIDAAAQTEWLQESPNLAAGRSKSQRSTLKMLRWSSSSGGHDAGPDHTGSTRIYLPLPLRRPYSNHDPKTPFFTRLPMEARSGNGTRVHHETLRGPYRYAPARHHHAPPMELPDPSITGDT